LGFLDVGKRKPRIFIVRFNGQRSRELLTRVGISLLRAEYEAQVEVRLLDAALLALGSDQLRTDGVLKPTELCELANRRARRPGTWRHGELSTPKYFSKWARGGGTAATRRTIRSCGSSTRARLPSFQGFLNDSTSAAVGRHEWGTSLSSWCQGRRAVVLFALLPGARLQQ
jgi:hypothetical protein